MYGVLFAIPSSQLLLSRSSEPESFRSHAVLTSTIPAHHFCSLKRIHVGQCPLHQAEGVDAFFLLEPHSITASHGQLFTKCMKLVSGRHVAPTFMSLRVLCFGRLGKAYRNQHCDHCTLKKRIYSQQILTSHRYRDVQNPDGHAINRIAASWHLYLVP